MIWCACGQGLADGNAVKQAATVPFGPLPTINSPFAQHQVCPFDLLDFLLELLAQPGHTQSEPQKDIRCRCSGSAAIMQVCVLLEGS